MDRENSASNSDGAASATNSMAADVDVFAVDIDKMDEEFSKTGSDGEHHEKWNYDHDLHLHQKDIGSEPSRSHNSMIDTGIKIGAIDKSAANQDGSGRGPFIRHDFIDVNPHDRSQESSCKELEELAEYVNVRRKQNAKSPSLSHRSIEGRGVLGSGRGEGTPVNFENVSQSESNIALISFQLLQQKQVIEEIQGFKDLNSFADEENGHPVLLDLHENTVPNITKAILHSMAKHGALPMQDVNNALVELCKCVGFVDETSSSIPSRELKHAEDNVSSTNRTSSRLRSKHLVTPSTKLRVSSVHNIMALDIDERCNNFNEEAWQWHLTLQGRAYIVALGRLPSLTSRITGFARLVHPTNLGSHDQSLTRFVVIVLGPTRDIKATKSIVETGQTFAALLGDPIFHADAIVATTPTAFRLFIMHFLHRQKRAFSEHSSQPHIKKKEKPSLLHDALESSRTPFFGLRRDLVRRLKCYKSDWTDGLCDINSLSKYFVGTIYMYFACVIPAIAFGALWNDFTSDKDKSSSHDPDKKNGYIGVTEILMSEAMCGMIFALIGGNHLMILRSSGPIAVYAKVISNLSSGLDVPFLPLFAWIGIWGGIMCIILAILQMSNFIKLIGRFAEEAFALMISGIFISKAIEKLVYVHDKKDTSHFYLAMVLWFGTYLIATLLRSFNRSFYLRPILRSLMSDFGPSIAFLSMTLFAVYQSIPYDSLKTQLPAENGFVTSTGRSWVVPLFDLDARYIFFAIVPALPLMLIVFLDQNVCELLLARPSNRLVRGPAIHWDLLVAGLLMIICSILGIPWVHGSLPHSVIHPKVLADTDDYELHGHVYTRVLRSRETRWTNFFIHLLMLFTILAKDLLRKIPTIVLYGYFMFLGISSLSGNHLWDRLLLWFTQKEKYPPNHYVRRVPIRTIHLYTLCQSICFAILWVVHDDFYIENLSFPPSMIFPILVFLMVPVRLYILPRFMDSYYLDVLSSDNHDDVDKEEYVHTG